MLERSISILRMLCLGLVALILVQCSRLALSKDPAADLRIPSVPASLTNTAATLTAPTNSPGPVMTKKTNTTNKTNLTAAKTNTKASPAKPDPKMMAARRGPGSMPGGPGPAMNLPELPPTIKSYIDRIVQSEILGQVPRPMPMALLGIAGKDAFIRGPDGQTGLVREGDSLGVLKLLRIGTNRVLVEHEGKSQELTIFSGLGSETLMPQGKEKLP